MGSKFVYVFFLREKFDCEQFRLSNDCDNIREQVGGKKSKNLARDYKQATKLRKW